MITPILETERLVLRPLKESDAEEIFKNWASDPEVAKFMSWSTHSDKEVTREWLHVIQANIAAEDKYDWGFVRKSDNKLIGSGGIYFKEARGMYTVGYNLMRDCWNQGYTTEAVARILQFAVKDLGQTRLFAYHAKDNPNSGKVMEKLGFHYTNDTIYDSMDGIRHFEAKEYLYDIRLNEGISE
ncbi:MAG: GCN5-related N-acetyltransferase [Anaerocolumna sp.]|jgi:ribosomal-protein-alanine N-acetyltransferase|nr:GCN5-related N-acetyltransferase [Anaerocolumna sp.]